MDFLYSEWQGKPASLVTWSITGGARGAAQLYQVLHSLHMRPLRAHLQAPLTEKDVDPTRQLINPERTFGSHRVELRTIDTELTTMLTNHY
ncbi:NADPH-dependent FMN reductase [Rhodococcoides yunnanense]|uniref:NADPH-dependent FMN reductase n=1 Tax=Rhodococcoides yunnanense TaxID=278209 RepID=UPI000932D10E|nr:hypothetical protein [Rhodococcus yunnanensis]